MQTMYSLRLSAQSFLLLLQISFMTGAVILSLPAAGNCGDDTVLTCVADSNFNGWSWFGNNKSIVNSASPNFEPKYYGLKNELTLTLTIKNTSLSDAGFYQCNAGFGDASELKELKIECQASRAVTSTFVERSRHLVIKVDKLYPSNPAFSVELATTIKNSIVNGVTTCQNSANYSGYYQCSWTSSSSLSEASYTYSLMVTTITPASKLTGSFVIANPQIPLITNVQTDNRSREVLYGDEGQPMTITCTSRGGSPLQTVVWYKNSMTSSNILVTSSSGEKNNDTYTVVLQHTLTPKLADDKLAVICRSYYPDADSGYQASENKSVILFLNLKPNQPVISQLFNVTSGGSVQFLCSTSGSRPAAFIQWVYNSVRSNGTVTETLNGVTETYTTESVFRKAVSAEDNGIIVKCDVTHSALKDPSILSATTKLNVQFPVKDFSTKITGNQMIVATGQNALTLTCTTGSSNPASEITWLNGTDIITIKSLVAQTPGENNGVVRSQQFVLNPTRYMDGNNITCSVANGVSMASVNDTQVLNLKYSPFVTMSTSNACTMVNGIPTCKEGERASFTCTAQSKPTSTFTWYHDEHDILTISPETNVHSYTITSVNRTHYGIYKCVADNTINPPDHEQSTLLVQFKPLSTAISGIIDIVANGANTVNLKCTSGTSNPVASLVWKVNGNIKPSNGVAVDDKDADYGGKQRERELILRPTRDNDGDIVSCEASNDLSGGISATSSVTLDLRYKPVILTMFNKTVVEGNYTLLDCIASSKPVSTFTWYRDGRFLSQGTGIINSNRLIYNITDIKRTDAAIYKCDANNGIETASQTIGVTVYYPPDVTVQAMNTSVKENKTTLTCIAKGLPDTGYTYRKWIQEWPGYGVVYESSAGSAVLDINSLTYEHSGIYTCSASNGIKLFNTEREYMNSSIYLVVKSFPIIVNPDISLAEPEQISGKLQSIATTSVEYYSNADSPYLTCSKVVNDSVQLGRVCTFNHTDTTVGLPVFSKIVQASGRRTIITIQIDTEDDFGLYLVNITNNVGSATFPLRVVPLGPPKVPAGIQISDIQQVSARASWIPGFHGGLDQTFVIQLSKDNVIWNNQTLVFGGKNKTEMSTTLVNLVPSWTYYLRLFAFNTEGRSEYTENYNFTTSIKVDTPGVIGAIIGGTVGGVVAFAILFIGAVLLVRRLRIKKGADKSQLAVSSKGKQQTEEDSSDEDVMIENKMYESAGQILTKDEPVYNKPAKKVKLDAKNTDVYAVVDKTKKKENQKVKKEKPKQKKQFAKGDIYENSPEKSSTGNNTYGNAAFDDNLYENPEVSKSAIIPKKNVNQDGLIYADLAFNDQPKGQKKLVIHGLDEMTTYVQVDFNRKADPLPDSDTEEQSENKKK